MGLTIGVLKGDTRSLDYSSCDPWQVSRGSLLSVVFGIVKWITRIAFCKAGDEERSGP